MSPELQPAQKAAPSAPGPRWPRIIRRVLFLAPFTVCAWFGWRAFDLRQAIQEAQALSWTCEYDNPIDAIRKDWRAAFRKATWFEGKRHLSMYADVRFERHARLLRRLAPKSMDVHGWGLTNLDALKGLTSLRALSLSRCYELTDLDALKDLRALETLTIFHCREPTNLDALKGHPALETLHLMYCYMLTNLDALRGLPALQTLNVQSCDRLASLEAVSELPVLRVFTAHYCAKVTAETIDPLKAARPDVKFPAVPYEPKITGPAVPR